MGWPGVTHEAGRVAWITGASSGIGEALALALGRAGWSLILSGRRVGALQRVAAAVRGAAPDTDTLVLPFEATAYDALPGVVADAIAWRGGIDLLVNNAGVSQRSMALDTGFEVYRSLMEVDFFAPLRLTQLVAPHMVERRSGRIVAISSLAGRIGFSCGSCGVICSPPAGPFGICSSAITSGPDG